MKSFRPVVSSLCLVVAFAFSQSAVAKSKPKNATAQCKDGTYSTAKTQQGACSKHGGVQSWFGDATSSTTVATKTETRTTTHTKTSIPKGATAQCKDGSYSKAKTQEGACSKHGGVQTWLAGNSTTAPATAARANENEERSNDNRTASTTETHGRETPTHTEASTVTRGAGTPATATAKCKDGSFSYSKQHSGACSHHGGVAEWYR